MDPLLITGLVRVAIWGVLALYAVRHKRALAAAIGVFGVFQSVVLAPHTASVTEPLMVVAAAAATPFVALIVSTFIIGMQAMGDTGRWRL